MSKPAVGAERGLGAVSRVRGAGVSPSALPRMDFNHFYALVPKATFDRLPSAPHFNRLFASTEFRTTRAGNDEWTGFYVYGQNTYFELFPHGFWGEPDGRVAIGFSDEEKGGLEKVQTHLQALYPGEEIQLEPRRRKVADPSGNGDVEVPWFRNTYVAAEQSEQAAFPFWVMEYEAKKANAPPPTRAQELAPKQQPDRLARAVTGMTFARPPRELAALAKLVESFGWRLTREPGGFSAEPKDGSFRLRALESSESQSGLRQVDFALHRPPTAAERKLLEEEDLGGPSLAFDGARAALRFPLPGTGADGASSFDDGAR